jgi:hypothetical protein
MKTAKHWYAEYPGTLFQAEHAKLVEQIQLDAYKAGMTRAAEIAWNAKVANRFSTDHIHNMACQQVNKAILTERNNLKELPTC